MAHFAVTAVGADRPGIVAAVAGVLMEQGGNLEDSSMTILGGHFAIMLIVDVPESASADSLGSALEGVAADLDLTVTVRPIAELASGPPAGSSWSVSVYGADRPGIVHAVTTLLASRSANIVDLSTRVVGEASAPTYVMLLEVSLADAGAAVELAAELEALAARLGVSASLNPSDADIL
ncbi:MAG: glycine cleavage system protein R [Acidimicrobiales bacterium]